MMSSTRKPHLEKPKVLEEVLNAARLAVMRIQKNLGHPSKELLCRALRIGGAKKFALRAASELTCDVCMESRPPKSQLPAKRADTYTEFNEDVGVNLFVLADSDERVFEFFSIVDLATRFNIRLDTRLPNGQCVIGRGYKLPWWQKGVTGVARSLA